jgi:hypothetical protein
MLVTEVVERRRRAVQVMDGSTRLRSLAAASARRHPLILDGLCLHVLSSFQRTGAARKAAPGGARTLVLTMLSGVFSARRRTLRIYDKRQPFVNPNRPLLRPFGSPSRVNRDPKLPFRQGPPGVSAQQPVTLPDLSRYAPGRLASTPRRPEISKHSIHSRNGLLAGRSPVLLEPGHQI